MNLFRLMNNELPPEMRVSDNQSLPINQGMELVLKKTDRHTVINAKFIQTMINSRVKVFDERHKDLVFIPTLLTATNADVRAGYCVELQTWVTLLNEVRRPLSGPFGANNGTTKVWAAAQMHCIATNVTALTAQEMQVNEVM